LNLKKSTLQLQLLKLLLEGHKICLKSFSSLHEISLRTAQRYVEDIAEIFSENLIKEGDIYSLISNHFLEKNMLSFDKKELEIFVDLCSLIDFDFVNKFDENTSNFLKKIQKNYALTYMLKPNAFENIFSKKELVSDIKNGIKNRRYVNINYCSDKEYVFTEARVLKIIYTKGNFYVAALTNDEINNGFKFLRLSFITHIELLSTTFHKDIKAEFFLKEFQTLFTQYDLPTYEVIVEVHPTVERYFRQKKFLKSQKIVQEKPKLQLSFHITNDMEILPLVKKWLPHLKIISPTVTKNKLNEELKHYLQEATTAL